MKKRNFLGACIAIAASAFIPSIDPGSWRELSPDGHWIYFTRIIHPDCGKAVEMNFRFRGQDYGLCFVDDGVNYDRRMRTIKFSADQTIYRLNNNLDENWAPI